VNNSATQLHLFISLSQMNPSFGKWLHELTFYIDWNEFSFSVGDSQDHFYNNWKWKTVAVTQFSLLLKMKPSS